ncbi:MAG: PAS domain S-box protein [Candidatus Liptonbacteria bacterium]|nr:PAS domain S-box protein [Candidatus Liptonbacteria bacterium]
MLGFSSNQEVEKLKAALESALAEKEKISAELSELKADPRAVSGEVHIFQSIVDASTEAILITDLDGNIIYVNPTWERVTGYSLIDIKGKNPRLLRSSKTPQLAYKKMWDSLKNGESLTTEEIINRRKDGTEYETNLSVFPIKSKGGEILFYGSLHQDITLRKESDRVRGEFVSLVSHQLNTPLSVINWYAQMLLSGRVGELNHKQIQYLNEIGYSIKRVINLVNALLNVSRVEMGTFSINPEPVSLAGIAEGVLGELAGKLMEKKLKLEKRYDETLVSINADSKIVWIVFQNLLSNAIKYTPEGGSISLSIIKDGENALIKVTDTGYGIPEDQKSQIFTKMFRADNVKSNEIEGNGLGLYIVKATLEAAGGKIWFESVGGHGSPSREATDERGTAFYVTIPLTGMKPRAGTKVIATTAEL